MDTRTRNPILGDGWRTGASKPAGLYGELPPMAPHPPAKTNPAPRPFRGNTSAG